jgi:transposase InsO family protein
MAIDASLVSSRPRHGRQSQGGGPPDAPKRPPAKGRCVSSSGPPTAITTARSFPISPEASAPTGPDKLWLGDITYIRIFAGFVYLAVILDTWPRRVYQQSHSALGYLALMQFEERYTCVLVQSPA